MWAGSADGDECIKHLFYEPEGIHGPKSHAVCWKWPKVWFARWLNNDSIFVFFQWINFFQWPYGARSILWTWVWSLFSRKKQLNIYGFVSWICLSRQKRYSASDLIDILLGQENWGRPNGRQIHFPKVMGLASGDSLLKDISGLVKATIRNARWIQIIPFIQNWQSQPWVNVYANGNDHGFQLWRVNRGRDRGSVGHGQLRVLWVLAGKVLSGIRCWGIKWNGGTPILWAEIRWI